MLKEVSSEIYSLKEVEPAKALSKIFLTASELNFPIALWRLPLTEEITLIVDLSGQSKQHRAELEELSPGFLAASFDYVSSKKAEFLSADLVYNSHEGVLKVSPTFNDQWTTELFFQKLNGLLNTDYKPTAAKANSELKTSETDKDQYLKMVQDGIDEIKKGHFKKVVLSRTKQVNLDPNFDPIVKFMALSQTYPGAFVNLYQLPGIGTWMGATPELLISQDKKGIFKTVSLAGTQAAESNSDPLQVGWTQKEIEEQALVGRYIINCFKKIRLREFEEDGPKTIRAANLYHLKSEYLVDTNEVNFPQLGSVMIELLHPTSAVCGMPKEESLKFIDDRETHDRKFYAGFIGPVNMYDQGSSLFVNLRCMEIIQHQGILYAGGGITEFSNPEKEWQETELKCDTLLKVIGE